MQRTHHVITVPFGRRCIHARYVTLPATYPGTTRSQALRARRLGALGGTVIPLRVPRQSIVTLLFGAAVLALAAVGGATSGAQDPQQPPPDRPGQGGPGEAAPWSVEGKPTPRLPRPRETDERRRNMDEMWSKRDRERDQVRCRILEVEELGRIYVEDVSGFAGGSPYWIQLPDDVKLRAERASDFGGRKKLKVEDLDVGQLLIMTLREHTDEIVKVRVRAAKA